MFFFVDTHVYHANMLLYDVMLCCYITLCYVTHLCMLRQDTYSHVYMYVY